MSCGTASTHAERLASLRGGSALGESRARSLRAAEVSVPRRSSPGRVFGLRKWCRAPRLRGRASSRRTRRVDRRARPDPAVGVSFGRETTPTAWDWSPAHEVLNHMAADRSGWPDAHSATRRSPSSRRLCERTGTVLSRWVWQGVCSSTPPSVRPRDGGPLPRAARSRRAPHFARWWQLLPRWARATDALREARVMEPGRVEGV